MTFSREMASIVLDALGVSLITVCTVPALITIIRRFQEPKIDSASDSPDTSETPLFGLSSYQDEDGEATQGSLEAFTASWQRVAIVLLSVLGFGVSLSQAIISIESGQRQYVIPFWLQMGGWVRPQSLLAHSLSSLA